MERHLKDQVLSIVQTLETGEYDFDRAYSDYDDPCAGDYLSDILDVRYVTDSEKEYLGCHILVAFGGPNIWINTHENKVEGYWGGETVIYSYHADALGICDYLEEYYNCM